jgi:uncharacterized protein (DUF305 family)
MSRTALALLLLVSCAAKSGAEPTDAIGLKEPFVAESDAAMARMMDAMVVKPTGDVDRDFVARMTPHHQGAIDMALAELRYGRNERVKRLAQEIIVTQKEEIAAMSLALDETATRR